jgi:hypothetical protein
MAMQAPPLAHKSVDMYPSYVYNQLQFGTQTPGRASDIPFSKPVQADTKAQPAPCTMRKVALDRGQSSRGLPFIAHSYLETRLSGVAFVPYVPAWRVMGRPLPHIEFS